MHRSLATAAVLAGSLAALAPGHADAAVKTRFERIAGHPSAGTPAKYNRVGILKVGRPKADNVLVLNPGTSASAAYFAPLARSIVKRSPKWQVWSVERRENLLEDHSLLDEGKAGDATVKEIFDYYLGHLTDPSVTESVRIRSADEDDYAKQWGMGTQMRDLRRVVLRAEKRGGKVVVGGHSLGGTMTTAYATWDFGGKAGAKGLDGLVYIDGASRDVPLTPDEARTRLDELEAGSPWLTFGGIPAPFTGLFNSTGSLGVKIAPDAPSLGQKFTLLPANLKPSVPVTNRGLYGYALDTETSPPNLAAAQANLGKLAASGDPRGWDDAGELTPLSRMADVFSGWKLKSLDGTAWYHPLKLTIDAGAVAQGNANPAQTLLGLRTTHGDDLPKGLRIYGFDAALAGGRVATATRQLAKQSGIPRKRLVLVDRSGTYAHNDPNTAAPKRNALLKSLTPFLRKVARG